MNKDAIRLFCDVAQCRSISKAAAIHGVTQSAVSQRLRALEEDLGVQLIDRSKRPLVLTGPGHEYYEGCLRLLSEYEQLKQRIAGGTVSGKMRGEVLVAAIYSAGIDMLNQITSDFEAKYPDTSVTISYLQPDAVHQSVRHGQCDLGILSYPKRWGGLTVQSLRDERMVLVTGPQHPLAVHKKISVAKLADYDMVGFDSSLPISRHIRRYLHRHGVRKNMVNQFDNIDTIKSYIAETQTLAILPQRTVQREVLLGVLATVELADELARPIAVVTIRQRPQTLLVKTFIDYLIQHQTPQPKPSSATAAK